MSGDAPRSADRGFRFARLTQLETQIEDLEQLRANAASEDYGLRLEIKERLRDLAVERSQLRNEMLRRPGTVAEARTELLDIERRLGAIDASHVDVVGQAGGGSAGGGFGFALDAHKLNQQIDAGADRTSLEARATRLRLWIEESIDSDSQ